MILFKRFALIYLVCLLCSLVPFLHISFIFGLPATTLASIFITLIFRKELGKERN